MSVRESNLWKNVFSVPNERVEELLNDENSITLFNIEWTTRCNNACTYCHFFAWKYDKSFCKDIEDDLFDTYTDFIKYFSEHTKTMVQYRFSWWDPIVLWDRLFDLADRGFKKTGIKPYVLTAWRWINEEWVEKGKKSALQNAFISVENPFNQDPWANPTENVIESIKKYNSEEFPLQLWSCIIKNEYFSRLLEICDYFYNETWQIPTIHELNYSAFEVPSDEQLKDLREQLEKVLIKYGDKLLLRLFPSVFPELCFWGKMVYLSDLPVRDSHDFNNKNNNERLDYMSRRFLWFSYPKVECKKPCELHDFCKNVKRFRQYDWNGNIDTKRTIIYCKMKKILSDVYLSVFPE